MKEHDAKYYISKLGLDPHPEGGYFKRTFESEEQISDQELTVDFEGKRKLYTSNFEF
ncbi:cupin domain-containing protein [Paenibacillus sp. FSL K6-0276]|uniref:cupin domain-containing protein n=1 Tax=Paenibacillus sp. FSL K6-0276 TaxID=2921450 RepID=UPI0030EF2025